MANLNFSIAYFCGEAHNINLVNSLWNSYHKFKYIQGEMKTTANNCRLLSFLNRSSDSWLIYASNSWLYCLQDRKSILEKNVFVMEFKRDSVVALYLAGRPQVAIVSALQCINTIARHRESGSVYRRQWSGRKKTATYAEMVRKVKKRLDRNPRRSGRKMARERNICHSSNIKKWAWSKVIEDPKSARSYQKKVRFVRAKELLRLTESGELSNLVFSGEKPFVIQ